MTIRGAPVPHFIGIGAQKAATSWIHACLFEHPQAFLPATKEIHYFSREFERGPKWYEEHFRAVKPDQIAGEVSPTYLYDLDAPHRIHAWNAAMKLVVCLRNPIERAISAYTYGLKQGHDWNVKTLSELFDVKPKILAQGLYHAQLERYLRLFDADDILITVYDDIAVDPLAFVQRIYGHLGIEASFVPSATTKKVNVSLGPPRRSAYHRALRSGADALRALGFERTVWNVARSRFGEALNGSNRRPADRPKLSKAEWARLADYFKNDVGALSQLLQRDLESLWLEQPAV